MSPNKQEAIVHGCPRITVHWCMFGFVCIIEDTNLQKIQIDFFMKAADKCEFKIAFTKRTLCGSSYGRKRNWLALTSEFVLTAACSDPVLRDEESDLLLESTDPDLARSLA